MPYRIINWEKYQGRKSRGHNPWVKLYKSILSSRSFGALSDKLKWQSLLLLLIAEDATGLIDYSDEDIAYKLRVKTFDPNPLLGNWLERLDTDGKPVDASGIPEANQRCARSSTSTSSSNQGEVVSPQTVEKWFRAFWAVYPRKVSKQDALKAFKDIQDLDKPLVLCIVKAVKAAKGTRQWNEDGGKYIPYPGTWLRGRMWDDELKVETKSAPKRTDDLPNETGGMARWNANKAREADEAQAKRVAANIAAKGGGTTKDGPQGLGPVDVPQRKEE